MKANLLAAAALVTGGLALASCSDTRMIPPPASSTPTPAPRPNQDSLPAPRPAANWIDNPATPGDWRWSLEGGQSVARFAAGRLVLRCDLAARRVGLERHEPGARPAASPSLRIFTQATARALTATALPDGYAADLAGRDPVLDAMAFTKGRFAVEAAGLPTLYVPSWTEVSRVVEDCR